MTDEIYQDGAVRLVVLIDIIVCYSPQRSFRITFPAPSCPNMLTGVDCEEERVLFMAGVGSKRNSLHFLGPLETFNR